MDIAQIQRNVFNLRRNKNLGALSIEERLQFFKEEVNEYIEEVQKFIEGSDEASREKVAHEAYDIIWNISDIANNLGIDLASGFIDKEAELQTRDFKPREART